MNWQKRLATLFVMLALSGCASMATDQVQAPVPSHSHDDGPDMLHGQYGHVAGRAIGPRGIAASKARSGSLTASSAATCFAERAERGDKPLFR